MLIVTEFERNKTMVDTECGLGMQVLYMLGDIASGPAYKITQWLELVRKRSAKYHSSGFPRRPLRLDTMPSRLVLTSLYCVYVYVH